jgi:hypothetical protein
MSGRQIAQTFSIEQAEIPAPLAQYRGSAFLERAAHEMRASQLRRSLSFGALEICRRDFSDFD